MGFEHLAVSFRSRMDTVITQHLNALKDYGLKRGAVVRVVRSGQVFSVTRLEPKVLFAGHKYESAIIVHGCKRLSNGAFSSSEHKLGGPEDVELMKDGKG